MIAGSLLGTPSAFLGTNRGGGFSRHQLRIMNASRNVWKFMPKGGLTRRFNSSFGDPLWKKGISNLQQTVECDERVVIYGCRHSLPLCN